MRISPNLLAILLGLLEIVVEIRGSPVSPDRAALVKCPPPTGTCSWEPEDTCDDDSQCISYSDGWINLCCPHACKGSKICKEFLLPTLPPTIRPTTEEITTTEYTTQPSTQSTTTQRPTSTSRPTSLVTTTMERATTTIPSTNAPTTVAKSTTTKEPPSTKKPSTAASSTTEKATIEAKTELATTELEKATPTTATPSTTEVLTTTEEPTTTKQTTTTVPPSTTLSLTTTTITTPPTILDPSVCGRSAPKDIIFVIDGTVNSRQYWPTSAKQFIQVKNFIKTVTSELKGDKFRIGVLQYGGIKQPKMLVDFPEGMPTTALMHSIDNIRQMGGNRRATGATLAVASNKLYEINSLYERAGAHDIVVLITRGRPSDKRQTIAEAEMLKRRKVRVITIGLTFHPKYLKKYLEYIPSSEEDLILTKYDDLVKKKTEVLEKLCVSNELPGSRSLCRNKKYDISFVVDGSRSIKHSKFDLKRKFLRDAFFLLESESDLNIGMIQFSTVEKTEEVLELQKHSLDEELHVIENMDYHSGRRTMLGDALKRVNEEVFTGRGGDRDTVENVLVIFSDGQSHDPLDAYKEAESMKEKDVRVIAVSADERGYIGPALKKLASHPTYVMSIDLSNTAFFANKVVKMICQTKE